MGRILSKAAYHVTVTCSICGADGELCPRRGEQTEMLLIACRSFLKAGWHLDGDPTVRMGDTHSEKDYGVGRWYCPACAAKRP